MFKVLVTALACIPGNENRKLSNVSTFQKSFAERNPSWNATKEI